MCVELYYEESSVLQHNIHVLGLHLLSGILIVSCRVLIRMLSCSQTYEHLLSIYFVIDKRLIRQLVSSLPKRVNNASTLVAKAGQRLSQISASRLLLTNIVFYRFLSFIQKDFQVEVMSGHSDQELQTFIQILRDSNKVKKSFMFLGKKLEISC